MNNLKKMKVVIATHEATTGPAHDVRDFLKDKVADLLFIAHPLLFIPANYKKSSYYEKYLPGQPVKRYQARHWQAPEVFLYVKDLILTIIWAIQNGRADIFVGSGNLSALSGVILKKLGLVDKVVFYCIDYVPERFANRVVNRLYHWVDRLACQGADVTWNLSPRMADGRNKRWERVLGRQTTLPIGVHFTRIHRLPLDQINQTEIIYMGTLLEKQGVQLVIGALTKIASQIPNLHFLVIGSGPYEEQLKKLAKQKGVEKMVTFTGYVEDHKQVEEMMAKGAVAVALYDKEVDQFSYYADPGKVKNYLAAGLPVIITDVPYIAREIAQKEAGVIVEYNEQQMVDAILGLLKDSKKLAKYRQNAIDFARDFDWDLLLTKAFGELVKNKKINSKVYQKAPTANHNFARQIKDFYGMIKTAPDTTNQKLNLEHIALAQDYRRNFYNYFGGLGHFKNKKVLEIGCGYGGDSALIAEQAKLVVSTDLHQDHRWKIWQKTNMIFAKENAQSLSFADQSFDVVCARDVLHHVDDPSRVVAEMGRVVKSGGKVIIIEANRYNPIFYVHLTYLLGHDHFTQNKFIKLVRSNFDQVEFFFIESHFLPIKNSILKLLWNKFHSAANLFMPPFLKSYNVAVATK